MSDRGAALRTVLADELPEAWNGLKWEQHEVGHYFRSICEHLGITWDMLEGEPEKPLVSFVYNTRLDIADAIATLLEAAGIER